MLDRRVDRAQLDQLITISGGVFDFAASFPGQKSFSVQQRAQLVVADKLWDAADVFCVYPPKVVSSVSIDFSEITEKAAGRITLNFRSAPGSAFDLTVGTGATGTFLHAVIAGDVWKHVEVPFSKTKLIVYLASSDGKIPLCFVTYSLDESDPSASNLVAAAGLSLPGDWTTVDELRRLAQMKAAEARRRSQGVAEATPASPPQASGGTNNSRLTVDVDAPRTRDALTSTLRSFATAVEQSASNKKLSDDAASVGMYAAAKDYFNKYMAAFNEKFKLAGQIDKARAVDQTLVDDAARAVLADSLTSERGAKAIRAIVRGIYPE